MQRRAPDDLASWSQAPAWDCISSKLGFVAGQFDPERQDQLCVACLVWIRPTAVNMMEGGLFGVGHVSYVPVPALICPVSPSRLDPPPDGEQCPDWDHPRDGSFGLCFSQFGHVGNVPHDRGTNMFTAGCSPSSRETGEQRGGRSGAWARGKNPKTEPRPSTYVFACRCWWKTLSAGLAVPSGRRTPEWG